MTFTDQGLKLTVFRGGEGRAQGGRWGREMRIERPTRGVSCRVLPGRPKSLDHDDLKVSGSDMISISVLKKKPKRQWQQ